MQQAWRISVSQIQSYREWTPSGCVHVHAAVLRRLSHSTCEHVCGIRPAVASCRYALVGANLNAVQGHTGAREGGKQRRGEGQHPRLKGARGMWLASKSTRTSPIMPAGHQATRMCRVTTRPACPHHKEAACMLL
eukprot:365303-Chlamydomonas_euryale.AAC.5